MSDRRVIHMLQGLPASGKSTLARQMVDAGGVLRVNKDDLRAMLHNGEYTPEKEVLVIDIRNLIIEHALKNGLDVVVDDTNLNPIHQQAIAEIAQAFGVYLDVVKVDTPVDECVRRDAAREKPVGEKVIRRMFDLYMAEKA